MARRRRPALALGALLLVGLIWLAVDFARRPRPTRGPAAAGAGAGDGASGTVAARPLASPPLPRVPALRSEPPSGPAVDAALARNAGPGPHFELYHGRSGRLAAGLAPGPTEPTTKIGATGSHPELTVWVPSLRADQRGTTIFARLSDDDSGPDRAVISDVVAGVEAGAFVAPTRFEPMREMAGPGTPAARDFTLRFVPPAAEPDDGTTRPPRVFRYLVVVHARLRGEPFERRAGGLFFIHDPGARIDVARAALRPQGGDLVLDAPAKVARAGTYFVYAELWGGEGAQQPIAFARDRIEHLGVGDRSLALRFGGKILRDAGIGGPYVVRNLRLQQVDTHPAQEAEPIAALPPTPAFPLSAFH